MPDSNRQVQLEQLLHAINHDLRAPLANIRSATSILLQDLSDPITEDQRVFIEIIDRATIRLLDQSNRLMLLNQIAFTQTELKLTPLSELLAHVQKELKNSYDIDFVNLIINEDPELNCHTYTLAATLAMLAAGDTKHQPDTPPIDPPSIQVYTQANKVYFSVISLMPAHEFAHSLIEISGEIIQRHAGKLEIGKIDNQKQFLFCLPLFSPPK